MWAGHCTSSLLPCRGSSRLLLFVGLLFVPGMWAFFVLLLAWFAMVWLWPMPGMWAVVGSLFFLIFPVFPCARMWAVVGSLFFLIFPVFPCARMWA